MLDELRPEMEACLEGFAVIDGKLRLVTSQRFIEPVAASPKAIQAFLLERGFLPVNDSAWYHPEQRIALFDVRPANVLEHDGLLYPVDIMPLVPCARMKALILEAMERRG